ncbi:hypothetical protein [Georgenia satyanarayanai]|uniref:hypothetical protein n=1 Tax=Georgenia satyanarayanai TaxID=860221 RepID=UPI0012653075|nr:hypothetical protein [Georgenia satyanarayanai]
MSDDDAAQRLRRPSWRDPRLGVGVLLVAASVALGSWAVARADRTTDVLLAVEALTPGDRLVDAELRPHAVRPDGLAGAYVAAGEDLPDDAVVTRVVGAGELVPAAAVGSSAEVDLRPVVIGLPGAAPSGVVKGAAVDLWVTATAAPGLREESEPEPPRLLAEQLLVSDLLEADSLFAGAGGSAVQVLVPRTELPAVLAAQSGEAQIVVVPVPGGGP